MNKEKRIEEMAKVMCEDCADYGDCKYNVCDAIRDNAKTLYNAGYRKQSEVTKEIFDEIEHSFSELRKIEYAHPILQHMFDVLDDLKKKYTDGERSDNDEN